MLLYSTITGYLRSFGIPVLITVGIMLNILSFILLRHIKSSPTAQYMSFLGLVDTGVLLAGAFSILLQHYRNLNSLPFVSWLGCKLVMFLFYTLADYSVLILVIMTAERSYGVWKPVHLNKSTKKRYILILSFLFCCLINSHFIFTHSIVEYSDSVNDLVHNSSSDQNFTQNFTTCEFVVWKDFYENYWVFIDAIIYSFIPFVFITIFNILIVISLNNAKKVNKQLTGEINSLIIKKQTNPNNDKKLSPKIDAKNIKFIDEITNDSLVNISF